MARQLLVHADMRTRDVVIKTPCGADWSAMDPRGTARFCGSCSKLVHDLSALSEPEAKTLLAGTSERLCVRYLHDASGEIWFGGGQKLVPVPRLTRGKRGLATVVLAAAPVLFQACGGSDGYGSEGFDAAVDGGADADAEADAPENAPAEPAEALSPDAGGGEGSQSGESD